MKYIIEHMEEGFSPWVVLEYAAIARDVGGPNLILTSVSPQIPVPQEFKDLGIVITSLDVTHLGEIEPGFTASRVLLLDPSAAQPLTTADAPSHEYFLFGGILGDHPPRDRTGELRKLGFSGRNLDKVQMTTDTAVRVTDLVVSQHLELNEIKYIDFPELKFNKHESTEMPFRYVKNAQGEPILPDGMLDLIRKDSEKSLDDLL